ncbi:acyl-CoA thioesterase [Buchnera aphidicola]|uniref:acyl-CoA thioesterase n=1 Tax=Buchnera aphidicola TaxID=9 RepID=UPI0031B8B344
MLKILAMPKNTNVNGKIFGGWIMSKMDLGGAILAKKISNGKVATVYVNNLIFIKPINVGDIVSCYAKCINIGKTSMKINIELWIKKIILKKNIFLAAKAKFVYVAIKKNGKKRNIIKI